MKMRYAVDNPDLAPDLDWMLESRQVSNSLLLERLLQEHYARIYHLAYSFLDDKTSAYQVSNKIFAKALSNAHDYRSSLGVDVWLDAIAWKEFVHARRMMGITRNLRRIGYSANKLEKYDRKQPIDEIDSIVNRTIDRLKSEDRWLFIAYYLYAWQLERIQQASGRTETAIQNRLRKVIRAIEQELELAEISTGDLGSQISEVLERRWTLPDGTNEDFTRIYKETERATSRVSTWRKPVSIFWEFSIFASVGILIIGLLWWFNRAENLPASRTAENPYRAVTPVAAGIDSPRRNEDFSSQPRLSPLTHTPLTPSPTATPNGIYFQAQPGGDYDIIADILGVTNEELRQLNRIPEDQKIYSGEKLVIPGRLPSNPIRYTTPIVPVSETLPLVPPDSADGVTSVIFPSEVTYHTIWFDAYMYQYQRISRDRIHRIYHIQLWLSEDQALILGGPVADPPTELMLWTDGDYYSARPGLDESWFTKFDLRSRSPIIDLRLLFGAAILLKQAGISLDSDYKHLGQGSYAGRESWILSEIGKDGRVQALVNVDKQTGFILRYQRLLNYPIEGNLSKELPDEVSVNSVMYDVDFPQELFNPRIPWRGGYAADYTGRPVMQSDR